MDYFTDYSLGIHKTLEDAKKWATSRSSQSIGWLTRFNITKFIAERLGYDPDYMNEENFEWAEDLVKGAPWTWYEHESDMVELSELYPNYYFVLEGEGEDLGDIWRTIFHNGKYIHTKGEIAFPDWDKVEI